MKKGFTVIEVLVSLALMTMILSFISIMFIKGSKNFYNDSKSIKEEFYIKEAFRYIDSLNYECKSMDVKGNTLEIYKLYENLLDKKAKATIFQSGNNLMVSHEAVNITKTTNVLVRNIDSFNVTSFGNTINIKITSKGNKEYEKCVETH